MSKGTDQARSGVVVIGGGYGGTRAASLLDQVTDVVLVEPRDAFVHNVAALRAVVDPAWLDKMFIPYDRLLARGEVLRDRVTEVSDVTGGVHVRTAGGRSLDARFAVLATGSGYPFPAKYDDTSADVSRRKVWEAHADLAAAGRVLILGAGPVGLELAGELRARSAETVITVVDPHPDLLSGAYPDEFRAELGRQLERLDIELRLGVSLRRPPTPPARYAPFRVTTDDGDESAFDLWFQCYGGSPQPGPATVHLGEAVTAGGRVAVDECLRVVGHPDVFAIGDVTDVAETKMSKTAELQATAVAGTIRAAVTGDGDPVPYSPAPPGLSLPLGPDGGASYNEVVGVLGAEETSKLKGTHLKLDGYLDLLGYGADQKAMSSGAGSDRAAHRQG